MWRCFVVGLAMVLAGCGFQLRGAVQLPYQSLYVALPEASEFGALLKRQLRANDNLELALSPETAQAVFVQVREERTKNILSVNSQGLVREYQLVLRYGFRLTDAKGQPLMPDSLITLTRDITFSDSAVLAKAQEEQLLWRDMLNDLTQQVLRRMAAAKPKPVGDDD